MPLKQGTEQVRVKSGALHCSKVMKGTELVEGFLQDGVTLENNYEFEELGVEDTQGVGGPINVERASEIVFPLDDGGYDFGGSLAELLAYGNINKCANYNLAPDVALTNILPSTNVVVSRVDESVSLRNDLGFGNLLDKGISNGYVINLENQDVMSRGNQIAGATGNTNKHSARLLVRSLNGNNITVRVGAVDIYNAPAVAGQWYSINAGDITPTNSSSTLQVRTSAGDTVQFVANQLEESSTVSPYINVIEGSTTSVDRIWLEGSEYVAASSELEVAALTGSSLLLQGAITNKCAIQNASPTDTTGLTIITGTGNLTVVDDEVELRVAGFGNLIDKGIDNGNVFKFEATSAGAEIRIDGQVLNTNVHSLSCVMRVGSDGMQGEMLLEGATSQFVFTTSTSYSRLEFPNRTPTSTTRRIRVRAEDSGDIIYFKYSQLEETTTVSESIVITEGAADAQALTDAKVATFSENLTNWSEDLTEINSFGSIVIDDATHATYTASSGDQFADTVTASTVAGATTQCFMLLSCAVGTMDLRLRLFDNISGSTNANITITTIPTWYEVSKTFDAGSTARSYALLNGTAPTANTVECQKTILTTCPIRPAYIKTEGTAAIYEKENLLLWSEDFTTGSTDWTVGGSASVSNGNEVFLDGSSIDRIQAPNSANLPVNGETYTVKMRAELLSGSADDTFRINVFDGVSQTDESFQFSGTDTVEEFSIEVVWGTTDPGQIQIRNTSGGSKTIRVHSVHLYSASVGTDGYVKTTGAAKQLRYGEWTVNDTWLYGSDTYLGHEGTFPRLFETQVDTNNSLFLRYHVGASQLQAAKRILGSNTIIPVSSVSLVKGDELEWLIRQSVTEGFTLDVAVNGVMLVRGENVGSTEDLNIGDFMQLANTLLLTAALSNRLNTLKRGEGTNITIDEARDATVSGLTY